MSGKESNYELELKTIELCKEIISTSRRWPVGYWEGQCGKEKAAICIRYVCTEKNDIQMSAYLDGLSKYFFEKHKLGNMLNVVFGGDVMAAVRYSIPGVEEQFGCDEEIKIQKRLQYEEQMRKKIEARELKHQLIDRVSSESQSMLCDSELRKSILKQIIENLNCKSEDIPRKLTIEVIKEYKLERIFKEIYDCKFYNLVEDALPGVLKPWEFCMLKEDDDMFPWALLSSRQGGGMHNSYYDIEESYWEIKQNRYEAFIWLYNKVTTDQGKKGVSIRFLDFKCNGLKSLIYYYNKSCYNKKNVFPIFSEFMPNESRPWLFEEECSSDYWKENEHLIPEAIQYVLTRNNITEDNILELRKNHFIEAHVGALLLYRYDDWVFNVVNDLFPDKFIDSKWLFNDKPVKLFNSKENRREAILWLIDRVGLTPENSDKLQCLDFVNNKLKDLLETIYRGSMYLVLDEVFPGKFSMDNENIAEQSSFNGSYEDSFGQHKKLTFNINDEDSIKSLLDTLANIFAPNPNSWVGRSKGVPFRDYLDETCKKFISAVLKGDIEISQYFVGFESVLQDPLDSFYEDKFNLYLEEETHTEDEVLKMRNDRYVEKLWDQFCNEYEAVNGEVYAHRNEWKYKNVFEKLLEVEWDRIMDTAKVRSSNLFDLYRAAHTFFVERNLHLDPYSIYMRLQKELYIPKYCSGLSLKSYAMDIDDSTFPVNKKHPAYHFESIVRCGEIEMYRLLNEGLEVDYFWAFPFELADMDFCSDEVEKDNEGVTAYLLHFNPGVIRELNEDCLGVASRYI